MPSYRVRFDTISTYEVDVDADNEDLAESIAREWYRDGDLDPCDSWIEHIEIEPVQLVSPYGETMVNTRTTSTVMLQD